jgi:hypothetical protein
LGVDRGGWKVCREPLYLRGRWGVLMYDSIASFLMLAVVRAGFSIARAVLHCATRLLELLSRGLLGILAVVLFESKSAGVECVISCYNSCCDGSIGTRPLSID